jgi:hypothetical protein
MTGPTKELDDLRVHYRRAFDDYDSRRWTAVGQTDRKTLPCRSPNCKPLEKRLAAANAKRRSKVLKTGALEWVNDGALVFSFAAGRAFRLRATSDSTAIDMALPARLAEDRVRRTSYVAHRTSRPCDYPREFPAPWALICSAVGRFPGQSPEEMRSDITRHSRFPAEEFRVLATERPIDVHDLHRRIHNTLEDAHLFIWRIPSDAVGFVFLDAGNPVQPDVESLGKYQRHAGASGGVLANFDGNLQRHAEAI